MHLWEIQAKVGEFDKDWRVTSLSVDVSVLQDLGILLRVTESYTSLNEIRQRITEICKLILDVYYVGLK